MSRIWCPGKVNRVYNTSNNNTFIEEKYPLTVLYIQEVRSHSTRLGTNYIRNILIAILISLLRMNSSHLYRMGMSLILQSDAKEFRGCNNGYTALPSAVSASLNSQYN